MSAAAATLASALLPHELIDVREFHQAYNYRRLAARAVTEMHRAFKAGEYAASYGLTRILIKKRRCVGINAKRVMQIAVYGVRS